jgi:hypothetical protein
MTCSAIVYVNGAGDNITTAGYINGYGGTNYFAGTTAFDCWANAALIRVS